MKKWMALILTVLLLWGCTSREQSDRRTTFCMDTVMDLQLWGPESDQAADAVEKMLRTLEQTWSATDENSLLRSGRTPSREEQAVLDRAEELSKWTEGAFDPKLHSLMTLWGFRGDQQRIPDPQDLEAALADPQWDLGGALKGYAGDRAVEILDSFGVTRALLNLGGNIQTFGEKPDGSPWQIAIENPDGGNYLGILAVEGTMAVVTSGDYQRYFTENGVRYHHILDPETGMPAQSGLRSVTVICGDGMTADALSTALFVMGLERGGAFWRKNGGFQAVFVTEQGTIYATEGAELSGCEFEVITQ